MDESQWLPKGVQIITPERQAMLGIVVEYDTQGIVKYARSEAKQTILQHLFRNHILDDTEYENGRDYQMWREMFRAFCGNQRMTANYGEARITMQAGSGYREQAYNSILRNLPIGHQMFINHAIDTVATPQHVLKVKPHHETYQRVFNRLGGVMDAVREQLALDGEINNQYVSN